MPKQHRLRIPDPRYANRRSLPQFVLVPANVVSICDSPEFSRVIEPGKTVGRSDEIATVSAVLAVSAPPFVLEGSML